MMINYFVETYAHTCENKRADEGEGSDLSMYRLLHEGCVSECQDKMIVRVIPTVVASKRGTVHVFIGNFTMT